MIFVQGINIKSSYEYYDKMKMEYLIDRRMMVKMNIINCDNDKSTEFYQVRTIIMSTNDGREKISFIGGL